MHSQYTSEQIARFWSGVDASGGPEVCWPWIRCRNIEGYGNTRIANQGWLAHRLAWSLAYGAIPTGLSVLHRCDNPPCCNPAHLWLGTVADNNADRTAKGRGGLLQGADNGMSVLTAEHVRAIRQRYSLGDVTQTALAQEFRVSRGLISAVVNYRIWRHVDGDDAQTLRRRNRLRPSQVEAVRRLHAAGASITTLAQACAVESDTIARLVQGKSWRNQDAEADAVVGVSQTEVLLSPERRGMAKLTAEQVAEIRRIYAAGGASQGALARQFGVSNSLVWAILKGRAWRHVQG